jgi:hypothetical protein
VAAVSENAHVHYTMELNEFYGDDETATFSSARGWKQSRAPRLTRKVFAGIFLPKGYPSSVTEDFLVFQIWDTLQAVSSYLRGILCTQACCMAWG